MRADRNFDVACMRTGLKEITTDIWEKLSRIAVSHCRWYRKISAVNGSDHAGTQIIECINTMYYVAMYTQSCIRITTICLRACCVNRSTICLYICESTSGDVSKPLDDSSWPLKYMKWNGLNKADRSFDVAYMRTGLKEITNDIWVKLSRIAVSHCRW